MIDKHNTGNIGLFYTCYCLAWHGWNVMPTIRNAKGADIFIISPNGKKFGVQVKALSGKADVFIGKNYADISVDFWIVLMNVRGLDFPKSYIIPAEHIHEGVEACLKGTDSNGKLVHCDLPKADGRVACYINAKFLLSDNHGYADAWETISKDSI